jgi:hypothetical protein
VENVVKKKTWQAIGCLACTVVLWDHLYNFDASEFSGGRLTGPLLHMADLGSLLFLAAVLLTFFLRRIAATIALAGYVTLSSVLPLHLDAGTVSLDIQR